MRYKNNVLDKLTQLGTTVSRVDIQVNRGGTQNDVNESIELSYICIKPYIITSMGQIKDNKPYIFFNAEPGVKNLKDYKNYTKTYNE